MDTQTNIVCDHVDILAEARSLIPEKMEAQVQKMKEAFETAAAEMGGSAEVEVKVMYPGFKFGEGDHVVEVAKKQQLKSAVTRTTYRAAAEVMPMLLQALVFQQLTWLLVMKRFIQQMKKFLLKN